MKFNDVSPNDTWSECIYTKLGNGILSLARFWSGTNHRNEGLSVDIQFVSHVSMKEFLVIRQKTFVGLNRTSVLVISSARFGFEHQTSCHSLSFSSFQAMSWFLFFLEKKNNNCVNIVYDGFSLRFLLAHMFAYCHTVMILKGRWKRTELTFNVITGKLDICCNILLWTSFVVNLETRVLVTVIKTREC